jgi:hypothetical protein
MAGAPGGGPRRWAPEATWMVTSLSASKVRPSGRRSWATTRSLSVLGQTFHSSVRL